MKAVVLEIRQDKVVVLSADGMMKEIGNRNYTMGQSIEMGEKRMFKMNKKYMKIASGLVASLVILLGGGSAYAYNTPVAHVSVDVNPSVMYSVNAFDKVIAVEMSNEDADQVIVDTIDWDGEELSVVIEKTILALKDAQLLTNTEWYEDSIMIGVNSDSEKTEQKLIKMIRNELQEMVSEESGVEIAETDLEESVVGIGAERVAEAAALSESLGFDVTPGKLNLVQKLNASLTDSGEGALTTTESAILLKGSVKEIMAQLHQNKGIGNPDQTSDPALQLETEMIQNSNGEENGNGLLNTTGKGIEKNKDKIKSTGSLGSGNGN